MDGGVLSTDLQDLGKRIKMDDLSVDYESIRKRREPAPPRIKPFQREVFRAIFR